MRVLVACEYSGRVRDAFRRLGHDAWSCDLLECEADPTHHLQCSIEQVLTDGWDLMVAHPPCTHLAVSGSRHFHRKQREQAEALNFVRLLMDAPIPRWCIENPVSVISSAIAPPSRSSSRGSSAMVKSRPHACGSTISRSSSPRTAWRAARHGSITCRQGPTAGKSAAAPIKALRMPWQTSGEDASLRRLPSSWR